MQSIISGVRWLRDNWRLVVLFTVWAVVARFTFDLLVPSWPIALAAATAVVAVVLLVASLVWARKIQAGQVKAGYPREPLLRAVRHFWQDEARRARITSGWARACKGQGLTVDGRTPRLEQLRRLPTGNFQARLTSQVRPISDVRRKVYELGQVIGCHEITITMTGEGRGVVEFRYGTSLGRMVRPQDLPRASRKGNIVVGMLEDGSPAELKVLNKDGESVWAATLAGGTPGAGKSGVLHAMIGGFIREQIPVRLWIYDPAGGVELGAYEDHLVAAAEDGDEVGERANPYFTIGGYGSASKDFTELMKSMKAIREDRLARMKAMKIRLWKPTIEDPLDLLVVDEWTGLTKAQRDIDSSAHVLLAQGRKSAQSAVALSQLGEKSSIGPLRELFLRRICLRTTTREMTVTFLGSSSSDEAALPPAERIDETTPGVFYMVQDQQVSKGRIAYYDDKAVEDLAAGILPAAVARAAEGEAQVEQVPCSVYRFYSWDPVHQERRLEYVGKALDPQKRYAGHVDEARKDPVKMAWWREVQRLRAMDGMEDLWYVIGWYPSEAAALEAEADIIDRECPRQNVIHNGRNPLRRGERRLKAVS